ncbi:MAG: inorganic phosphate transporter, partial [Spirochaetia bacterium]
ELFKVLICWVGTPIGAAVISFLLYPSIAWVLNKMKLDIFSQDTTIRWALILTGIYGSYALGANNVANVTGVYVQTGLLTEPAALLIGGGSIAFGVLTFSRPVMTTVGSKLVRLDPFTAFIATLGHAITVHFYAKVGVPVSTSQAIIGAVLGIGLYKGMQTINLSTLGKIAFGWVGTPLIAFLFSFSLYYIFG